MVSQAGQIIRMDLSPRDPPSTTPPGSSDNRNGRSGFAGNKNKPPAPPPPATSTPANITPPPATTSTTAEVLATSASSTPPSETSISPNTPSPPPSTSSTDYTPSPTPHSTALTTISTQQPTPTTTPTTTTPTTTTPTTTTPIPTSTPTLTPTQSSIASISIALTPSVYSQTSPVLPTQSFVGTTLQTSFTSTSSKTALPTGTIPIVTVAPSIFTGPIHGALTPSQKAGVAIGVIVGLGFLIILICLLFTWRKGQLLKALPRLGSRGNRNWLSRSKPAAEISDSLLASEAGRGSLGWDYRSTFAQPTPKGKSRRSLSRSLRRFVRFNPLAENPITPNGTEEETPSRNSIASFFHRRSTASTTQIMVDVESPPALPPLPPSFLVQPPATTSSDRSTNFEQSDTDDFLRPPTIPSEVLPPAFHRSWCYRNSQTTMASEDSETRSFKSVPGWVKFHYPRRLRDNAEGSQHSWRTLPAPQALSPGSWLRAKLLRRSQSPTASAEKGGSHVGTSTNFFEDKSTNTESPVLGKSEWKQAQETYRISYESVDSLVMEKQQPRQM